MKLSEIIKAIEDRIQSEQPTIVPKLTPELIDAAIRAGFSASKGTESLQDLALYVRRAYEHLYP